MLKEPFRPLYVFERVLLLLHLNPILYYNRITTAQVLPGGCVLWVSEDKCGCYTASARTIRQLLSLQVAGRAVALIRYSARSRVTDPRVRVLLSPFGPRILQRN